MQIHIGQTIREELRRQGNTNEWLADRIHVHPRTVQKIFAKPTIDTRQLLAISLAMGVDFFGLYSQCLKDNQCLSERLQ
jgi:plasmid maintenance system antidote protein VapI